MTSLQVFFSAWILSSLIFMALYTLCDRLTSEAGLSWFNDNEACREDCDCCELVSDEEIASEKKQDQELRDIIDRMNAMMSENPGLGIALFLLGGLLLPTLPLAFLLKINKHQ